MTIYWMLNFLKLVVRDTFLNLRNELRYLSGFKMVKLVIMSFFAVQVFYFASKFLVYFDFSLSWAEISYLAFVVLIFPIIFAYEKFLSGVLFVYTYDLETAPNFWQSTGAKVNFYGHPKRAWLVYVLSQAATMIDVVIFAMISVAVLLFSNFTFSSIFAWLWMAAFLLAATGLLFLAIFLWNRTFQVFRFWDKDGNVRNALRESHDFTTAHPRKFITLHTFVKLFQFIIPAVLALLIYANAFSFLTFINTYVTGNFGIYVVMTSLVVVGYFTYQTIVTFSNSYSFRLANYFEKGFVDVDYKPTKLPIRKDTQILRHMNYAVLIIGIALSFSFIHTQIVAAIASTEQVKVSYPNIIKIYSGGLNSTTTIDNYLTPSYANGVAVSTFVDGDILYAQPLVAQMNNPLVPSAIAAADIPFFNLSQTFVPAQMKISLKDALEFSSARKFALFIYINNAKTLELLAPDLVSAKPSLTILMTDSENLSKEISEKFPNYRLGTLTKIVDLEKYTHKQIFLFNKDIDKKTLGALNDKGTQTYVILKAGESPDPALDLSSLQGVFTDLPQLSYTEVRSISEEDVLKKVILSPLKIFGF
jgi:hypothetical protein